MKKLLLVLLSSVISHLSSAQNVGIGTATPNASAKLDVTSTNSGFLPPRMTSIERDAIANPAAGLMIFNTTTSSLEVFRGGAWFNAFTNSYIISPLNRLYGGSIFDEALSVARTNDGGYIVAGMVGSSNSGTFSGLNNHGSYDIGILKLDSRGNVQWKKLVGGTGGEQVYSVKQTSDGGYIVGGNTQSSNNGDLAGLTNNGPASTYDGYIIKLDATGNFQWQRLYGGSSDDYIKSLYQTADNGFIVAGYTFSSNSGTLTGVTTNGNADYWIMKLDISGNVQWQKVYGGSSIDYGESAVQTSDGGYIIAGITFSINSGTLTGVYTWGGGQAWIIKMNNIGEIQWQKLFDGNGTDWLYNIQATTDGGYVAVGYTSSTAQGEFTGVTNNGGEDGWILKLNNSGIKEWQLLLGGSGNEQLYDVNQATDGGFAAVGYAGSSNSGTLTGTFSNGSDDYYVVRINSTGAIGWQKLFGGSSADRATSFNITGDGGYIIVGRSSSSNTGNLTGYTTNGNADYWVLRIDTNGNVN